MWLCAFSPLSKHLGNISSEMSQSSFSPDAVLHTQSMQDLVALHPMSFTVDTCTINIDNNAEQTNTTKETAS